ncbi:hypothetical protein EDD21DRAFT_385929 [Dissophora ornata]|nr:hypothetical protein EDD21DRAFT_385929 [Dissophora ornata]
MDSTNGNPHAVKTIRGQSRLTVPSKSGPEGGASSGEVGRYVFGDVEQKVCYCRILKSRKVMVRVGGGWSELSKFMEDHASLEQRKAKSRLLSASSSSASVASHFGGSTSGLNGVEPRYRNVLSPLGRSSDSLSDSHMSGGSGSGEGEQGEKTANMRKKKEMVLHIRSDDMSIKTIKVAQNGADGRAPV